MPFYNHMQEWNGLEIVVSPVESWRKRICFLPYFVGQKIQLELRITKNTTSEDANLQFHLVEKMADVEKPRMIAPILSPDQSTNSEKLYTVQDVSRITGKGEIKYWLSTRGYNVEGEPIFSTEAITLDTLVIPITLMSIGPLIGFLCGLLVSLFLNN